MDAHFDPKECRTTISFLPKEADRLSVLMQLVIEEEKKKGTRIPHLENSFFIDLATTKVKFSVEFDFESLPFIIAYLDEVINEMQENGGDATDLNDFVGKIFEFCPEAHTLQ